MAEVISRSLVSSDQSLFSGERRNQSSTPLFGSTLPSHSFSFTFSLTPSRLCKPYIQIKMATAQTAYSVNRSKTTRNLDPYTYRSASFLPPFHFVELTSYVIMCDRGRIWKYVRERSYPRSSASRSKRTSKSQVRFVRRTSDSHCLRRTSGGEPEAMALSNAPVCRSPRFRENA